MNNKVITMLVVSLVSLFIIAAGIYFIFFGKNKTRNKAVSQPTPTITIQQAIQDQQKADTNYSNWRKEIDKNYPWMGSLPLQTDNYFVYFDQENKKIIGKIYTPDQTEQIKSEVTAKLTQLGVDLKNI